MCLCACVCVCMCVCMCVCVCERGWEQAQTRFLYAEEEEPRALDIRVIQVLKHDLNHQVHDLLATKKSCLRFMSYLHQKKSPVEGGKKKVLASTSRV